MEIEEAPTSSNIRYVKGIGPKRAAALEKLGILSIHDLLYFFPRRYEDRSRFRSISNLRAGEFATVRGEVLTLGVKPIRRMRIFELVVGDAGDMIHAVWFNQPYLKDYFSVGQEVILYGRVDLYQNRLQMTSPEFEIVEAGEENIHTGRITPIYPLTEGLFQRSLRSVLKEIQETQLLRNISDWLPPKLLQHHGLMELPRAIQEMHFPSSFEEQEKARRRIVFDEFMVFELTLIKRIEAMREKYRSNRMKGGREWAETFKAKISFALTPSQSEALGDISEDLDRPYPMNRLLQGDVGSGKTIVGAFGLSLAARNKLQAALLAPTEILAEQHYKTLSALFKEMGVSVALLTSSVSAPKRQKLVAELKQGKISVLVGTHAILSEDVKFSNLSLVIIDEQHKFGVYQRYQLLNSDPRPHQLVMTATPIPRTLALTIYGDLDVSTMKELPSGRQPIKTFWISRQKQLEVLAHIHKKLKAGEQCYFIFPLIEETEKSDLLAAKKEYDRLKKTVFKDLKVGLVHGKISSEERESIMKAFFRNEIHVLVATSVIEVGVNNPNATVMVIENAERFGLSQLHQMRGRIGRGEKPSECFLFGEPKTIEGQKRLRILTKTQDGFVIAEEDLKLRGPGDFWGSRQSGEVFFRIANPITDQELLLEARESAQELIRESKLPGSSVWPGIKKYLEQFQLRY